jgi:hypothetical protein
VLMRTVARIGHRDNVMVFRTNPADATCTRHRRVRETRTISACRGSGGILEIQMTEFAIVEVARVTQATVDAQADSIRVRRTIGLDPPQPDSTVYEFASASPDCPEPINQANCFLMSGSNYVKSVKEAFGSLQTLNSVTNSVISPLLAAFPNASNWSRTPATTARCRN